MKVLVTGAAGFIGAALCGELSARGIDVVGIDNINPYYDPRLKHERLRHLGFVLPEDGETVTIVPLSGADRSEVTYREIPYGRELKNSVHESFRFIRLDITDKEAVEKLWEKEKADIIVNLAAQAGVRYSVENPSAYVETNIGGFVNLLECARRWPVRHFIYASSSSVYGSNTKVPFSESDRVDNPVSVYAATKRCDELLANVYSGLYAIPMTGLRFFTVYGPWGRPDMAPMLFSEAITHGDPIKVFNGGDLSRDFTYIDDIVEGIARVIMSSPEVSNGPRLYNIGYGHPERLEDFISLLEKALGKKAEKIMCPMQSGDVYTTFADTAALSGDTGYVPRTSLGEGVRKFADWFCGWKESLKDGKTPDEESVTC